MRNRGSIGFAVTLSGSLVAVATALVSQYLFDMPPCAWCVLQRLIFLAIAAVSALAMWLRPSLLRAALGGIIVMLSAGGIASALYQHFVAARATTCSLSLAEKIISGSLQLDTLLPSVFGIGVGCSASAAAMLGIPYEFWSLAAFGLLIATLGWSALQPPRRLITQR
jgi:protein dithiol:quinone oxidoreductase